MKRGNLLVVSSRAEWRDWLSAHHTVQTEVWLVFRRTGIRAVEYDDAVEEALCFGWYDALQQTIDGAHYGIQFVPRPPQKRWTHDYLARALHQYHTGRMVDAGVASLPK